MVLIDLVREFGLTGLNDVILYTLLIVLIYKLPKGIFGRTSKF